MNTIAPPLKTKDARSSREVVYQAIVDLANANRAASRQIISNHTGLKMSIVDDHIKRMKEHGVLRTVVNGVVELTQAGVEDRAVSMTYIPKGGCKLEIGDVVIHLTMREACMVSMAAGGVSLAFAR